MSVFVTHEEPAGACICASFADAVGARAYIDSADGPGKECLTIRAASALINVNWGAVDPLAGLAAKGDVYADALAAFRALDCLGAPPLPATVRLHLALADSAISVNEWKAEARLMDNARGAAVRETEAIRREKMALGRELDEARELLAEWKGKADKAGRESLTYREQRDSEGARAAMVERQRNEAVDRAYKAETQLARLMGELGGLTLSMLPKGAYGGALADAYCDIKAGR